MDRVCSLLRGVDLLMEVTSKLVTIYLALLLLRAGSLRRNRLRQLALSLILNTHQWNVFHLEMNKSKLTPCS